MNFLLFLWNRYRTFQKWKLKKIKNGIRKRHRSVHQSLWKLCKYKHNILWHFSYSKGIALLFSASPWGRHVMIIQNLRRLGGLIYLHHSKVNPISVISTKFKLYLRTRETTIIESRSKHKNTALQLFHCQKKPVD